MINAKQRIVQNVITHSSPKEASHKVREIGQLRRAKMHASCLIEDIDSKNALTPTLRELLEASLTLQTISTKILAAYLHRSPAKIRAEFQQILNILGDDSKHSSFRTPKDKDFLSSGPSRCKKVGKCS